MNAIYKYKLGSFTGTQKVKMPYTFKILKLAMQNEELVFWAAVNPLEEVSNEVKFHICWTGDQLPDKWEKVMSYVDTYESRGLIYHVFVEDK